MKQIHRFYFSLLIVLVLFSYSCTSENATAENSNQRSFYMGTTPWPSDLTLAAVDQTYQFINDHCDIVSHHFNDGIPYEEAYNNVTMPSKLSDDVAFRKARTATNKKVFLSVAALSINRVSKDLYYKEATTPADIKAYWEQLPFDDTKVITAYINYVSWLIDAFHPTYVNYGVESNSALWNATDFAQYKTFLAAVYSQLKTKYPNLPFFISFMVDESNEGYQYAHQLLAYTDFIGLSAYPYVTVSSSANGNTDPDYFPNGYFERFINLDSSKPWVFAETGYIAQNLYVTAYNLNKQGTPDWQKKYLEKVLQLCHDQHAKLLIWFCSKDYDALITTFQNQGTTSQDNLNLMALWRDTGLVDENDVQRPAYNTWLNWMSKEKI